MIELPPGHLRLPEAARRVGRSCAWLARLAWDERIPFLLLRTTARIDPSCDDLVFAVADLESWQSDGVVRACYTASDRDRADAITRAMVRAGMEVDGA